MPTHDFSQLFNQINAMSIGFAELFHELSISPYKSDGTSQSTYPPFNIYKPDGSTIILEMAVAGFKKEDVDIEEHNNILTIKCEKASAGEPSNNNESYQYRRFAKRSFVQKFTISEYYNISTVTLEDGILTILFSKNEPEETKPKKIKIK